MLLVEAYEYKALVGVGFVMVFTGMRSGDKIEEEVEESVTFPRLHMYLPHHFLCRVQSLILYV